MSNSIKELYDYELVKKCGRCKLICLNSNLYKNENMSDGLHPRCKFRAKKYYNENRDEVKQYYLDNRDRIKKYQLKNHDQNNTRMNECVKNRMKTDVDFRLIRDRRRRIHHALNGKSKSSSTREFLGIYNETYKKWMEFQMTPERKWDIIEIDHVKPICMFDVSKEEEIKETFCWKNTQPLFKHDHQKKGIKFIFLDYQIQCIKAYQFLRLNGHEGYY